MPRSYKTVKDKLDEALGATNSQLEPAGKQTVEILPPAKPNSMIMHSRPDETHLETQEDYDYARKKYKELVEMGMEALEGLKDLADELNSPRTYEVLGELISSVSHVVDASITLQEKMDKLRSKTNKPAATNPLQNGDTNIIFTGSNADLLDVISQARDAKKDAK